MIILNINKNFNTELSSVFKNKENELAAGRWDMENWVGCPLSETDINAVVNRIRSITSKLYLDSLKNNDQYAQDEVQRAKQYVVNTTYELKHKLNDMDKVTVNLLMESLESIIQNFDEKNEMLLVEDLNFSEDLDLWYESVYAINHSNNNYKSISKIQEKISKIKFNLILIDFIGNLNVNSNAKQVKKTLNSSVLMLWKQAFSKINSN